MSQFQSDYTLGCHPDVMQALLAANAMELSGYGEDRVTEDARRLVLEACGLPEGGWHPEHDVTMAQALRAYTLGSAEAVGRAAELGTLEEGKLADLVVWDTDLLACDADQIQGARPLATFVGGRCVYEDAE